MMDVTLQDHTSTSVAGKPLPLTNFPAGDIKIAIICTFNTEQ